MIFRKIDRRGNVNTAGTSMIRVFGTRNRVYYENEDEKQYVTDLSGLTMVITSGDLIVSYNLRPESEYYATNLRETDSYNVTGAIIDKEGCLSRLENGNYIRYEWADLETVSIIERG